MSSPFPQQLNLGPNRYHPALGNDLTNGDVPQPVEWMHSQFDGLHQQRSYLLNSLQYENLKATDLLRKITQLEDDLLKGALPKRKMKKQLGWLKSRHQETCRQERTILAQLGRVSCDIQRQERVAQVKNELRYLHAQGRTNSANYDSITTTMQQVHLNPALPAFDQPGNAVPSRMPSIIPEWQQQHGDYNWQDSTHDRPNQNNHNEEVLPNDDPVEEAEKSITRKLSRPVLVRRTVSMNDADVEPCCSQHTHSSKWSLTRRSLPTLPGVSNIWRMSEGR